MFTHFNFWYLFAPLGAFVAAYVGYKRSHRNGKHYARLDARSAWLDIVIATVAASILCALFYIESHRGMYEFFVVDANDGLAVLVGLICMVFAPPIVSAIYGWALWKIGHRFAKIGICIFYCRTTQYRNRKGEVKCIIDFDDLLAAIAKATAREQRTRLLLQVIFWKRYMENRQNMPQTKAQLTKTKAKARATEQRKVKETISATPQNAETAQLKNQAVSFAPVSTDIRETALPTQRPAPSENLVTTTLHGPDGKVWEVEVPENRVADLQLAMLRYCNTMAAAQKLIQTSMREAEAIRLQRVHEENWQSFLRELEKLDRHDQKLITATLRQYPLLRKVIESENLHIRLRLVGKGANRQVRFYSMRFSAAS